MATQSNWQKIVDLVSTGQNVGDKLDEAFQAVDDNATELDTVISGMSSHATDINGLKTETLEHERQLNMDTSKLGVDIDTILTTGYYEVDTGLPNGSTLGRVKIVYDTNLTSRVIQTFTDSDTKRVSVRQHNGSVWSTWTDDSMNIISLGDVSTNPPLQNAPLRWNGYQHVFDGRDLVSQYITLNNGNIIWPEFSDGSAEGQYLIMKANGHLGLKTVPDADHVQKDERSGEGDIEAPLTFIQLHTITADVDYLVSDSSWTLDFTVDNVSGTDRTLTIEFRVNDVASGSQDFTIWGDVTGQNVEMSGKFGVDRVTGDIFTIHIKADKEADVFVKTNVDISELIVTKAVGASIARIEALEDKNIYEFSKASDSSTTIKTYQVLNALLIPNAPSGVYEYKFSLTFNYSTTLRSAYFKFSLDNGVSWTEFRVEAKDNIDNKPMFYAFPKIHNGGDLYSALEYRCENDGDILNVPFSDIVIERKQ